MAKFESRISGKKQVYSGEFRTAKECAEAHMYERGYRGAQVFQADEKQFGADVFIVQSRTTGQYYVTFEITKVG